MPEFSREIYSFIEIAREQSIRGAAEKLNISSSALSRQMQILEADLGVSLLVRRVTGVELTEQGRTLLRQAEKWLDDGNRLRAELARAHHDAESVLRVGAMECFADNLMPELFAHARSNGLAHRIEAKFGGTEALLQDLQDDQLDLVIAFNAQQSQTVRLVSEHPCRIGMIHAPGLVEIAEAEIPISACLQWPICLPDKNLSLHTRLYAEILKQRRRVDLVAVTNSLELIRELVARGECVSFLTWFDIRKRALAGQIAFVPLTQKRLAERLCVCVSGTRRYTRELASLTAETARIVQNLTGREAVPGKKPVAAP
ncbi:MAG: LysR family transcriptional regulator [Nitratireductor sp.]|nr:LysR family transcriptional regulator [Nitratireductor sp.]